MTWRTGQICFVSPGKAEPKYHVHNVVLQGRHVKSDQACVTLLLQTAVWLCLTADISH